MQNCELCCPHHPRELWRDKDFYVIDASEKELPVFVRVVAARHAAEMTDLTSAERSKLYAILTALEETMIACTHPDKVNLASLGNMVPHVHWHLIGRWRDDPFFPGSVWSHRLRNTDTAVLDQRRKQAQNMLEEMKRVLEKLSDCSELTSSHHP